MTRVPLPGLVPPELATARGLVILLDLDAAIASVDELDDELVGLFQTLQAARVRIVLASARSRDALEPLRTRVPGAWWAAERGAWCINDRGWCAQPILAWIQEQSQEPVLLAVTNAGTVPAAFADMGSGNITIAEVADVDDEEPALRTLLRWIASVRLGVAG